MAEKYVSNVLKIWEKVALFVCVFKFSTTFQYTAAYATYKTEYILYCLFYEEYF